MLAALAAIYNLYEEDTHLLQYYSISPLWSIFSYFVMSILSPYLPSVTDFVSSDEPRADKQRAKGL